MSYGSKQSDLRAAESEKNRAGVRVSMPVKVLAFYPDKMTVDVQPLVKESIDGQYASAAPLMGLRGACPGAGGVTIRPGGQRGAPRSRDSPSGADDSCVAWIARPDA